MRPDTVSAALEQLAGYVQKRQLASNREHWDHHVTRQPGARGSGESAEELERHVHLFAETRRELELHPDCLAPREARLWRVLGSFFALQLAPQALLNALASVMRQLGPAFPHPVPPSRTGLTAPEKRWECWRKVRNDAQRQKAWNACISTGAHLRDPFAHMISLRNEIAHSLGHKDFFEYRLHADGWDPTVFCRLLGELDRGTSAPYVRARAYVDEQVGRLWRRSLPPGTCWQYGDPWVQTAPEFLPGHPSRSLRRHPEILVRLVLNGLGWSSRLYQLNSQKRATWFPTAFCLHMNRGADIRIAANLGSDLQSLQLLLHEAGHAAWFAHLDPGLPFLLRTPAHPLLSEGFSMLMQRLPFLPSWLRASRSGRIRGVPRRDRDLRRADWIDRLFFARWSLALIRFEHRLYAGGEPDHQRLYWDMVRTHQGLEMPPGREDCVDYLSKHHLITHPASYHHYLFGMCFSSQLARRLARLQGHDTDPLDLDLTGRASMLGLTTTDSLAAGEFLRARLFAPGADQDDPFALAADLCEGPFSAEAFLEDLVRLETLSQI